MRTDSPTDVAHWRRIEAILDLVLDLPPEEHSALLDQACAGDSDLRAEVEALLVADAKAGSFLGVPAGDYAADLFGDEADEDEVVTDLVGRQVGPYRLLREIGGGGMGTVYEAEDTRLGRRVAVKVLPPEFSRDRKAKERFLREARAAAAVDHPNLCTIHDVGESDSRLYIVLSYYEGETLRERIRRGPLPLAEAREVAIQIARGLARAHEAGIVHRDIKPANVMLTRRGEAKILDFGIARLKGDEVSLTRTGASWGTPAYMSPEQIRGEPVDSRTDVWSLGVLLYEMVAGQRPFNGESMEAVVSAILTHEPEPLKRGRPPDLARVVDRALAKDRAERYANAAELLADLESEELPKGSATLRRPSRKGLWKGLVTAALAISALIIVLLWRPWRLASKPPVRVAVLRPVVKSVGKDAELSFVASDVMEATLATLVSLKSLQPLDPPERNEKSGAEIERLRAAEADEVLLPRLNCQGDWCHVVFRRLRKLGGEVLATVGPFEVQMGIENAHQLAEGVRANVQQIYSDHPLRSGSPSGKVRPQDYSAYIQLEHRVDRGERLGNDELARLDSLLRASPGLVGAYLLAAGIARNQGTLGRAFGYVARAEKTAPYDPGVLFTRIRIELEAAQLDAASTTLARLEKLAPGDARVQSARADLLEAQGELEQAFHLREEVAHRRPTWRNILEVATLEFRLGASDSAQLRLKGLLAAQPDNQFVLENIAALEVGFGDLKRAMTLYERLIRVRPTRPYFTNLGFVRFLLGDYAGAAEAYRRALALKPSHLLTRFNLATALEAQGDLVEARRLYGTLAKELAAGPPFLDARTRMLYAQCLARTGNGADAEQIADEVLKQRPEDVQVLNQAAQLYALLGDRVSARYYALLALKKGLRREWFTIPEFRSFKEDPEFRALLDSRRSAKGAS